MFEKSIRYFNSICTIMSYNKILAAFDNGDSTIFMRVLEGHGCYHIGTATEDYYIQTSFKNEKEFNQFVKTIKKRTIYDYGIEVSGKDQILTLSSCIGDGKKRVVLHAKLIGKE